MLAIFKKFKMFFITLGIIIFVSLSMLCIFKFNLFFAEGKHPLEIFISGAASVTDKDNGKPWAKNNSGKIICQYPTLHYDGNSHNSYVYFYDMPKDVIEKLIDGDGIECKIRNNGIDQVPESMFYTVKKNAFYYVADKFKFTFSKPGYYRFLVYATKKGWSSPDGYGAIPDAYGGVSIIDVDAKGVETTYSGKASSIQVDPGTHAIPDHEGDPLVRYSMTDPRTVSNPENPNMWSNENPSFKDVGTYIVYYRVKTSLPFYDVEGQQENNIDHVFYGSATVKINPKQSIGVGRKNIFVGSTGLTGPRKSEDGYYYYDNVYLGSFIHGSYSNGIKFKLLSTSADDDFYKGGFLLLSSNVLGSTEVNKDASATKMFYQSSSLSCYMNNWKGGYNNEGMDIYHKAFSTLEKSSIFKLVTKSDEDKVLSGFRGNSGGSMTAALGSFLKEDNNPNYLFALSAVEAHNQEYGFSDNLSSDNGRGYSNIDVASNYWSSSLYRYESYEGPGELEGQVTGYRACFQPGVFTSSGYFQGANHASNQGIRPALNFDATKVILTSTAGDPYTGAKGAKALPTTENFIKTTDQNQSTDFKFTLKDDSLKFDLNLDNPFRDSTNESKTYSKVEDVELTATTEDRKIIIPYKDVKTGESSTYLSVLIVNSDTGAVEYYGRPANVSSASGDLTIILPLELEKGKYKLKLFEEKYNGGNYDNNNLTDYGSEPVEIGLTMLQTLQYEPIELNQEIFYDGEWHGFGKDFRVVPQNPVTLSEVDITYKDANTNDPFSYDPRQKKDPNYDENGNVIPYEIEFKISPANSNSFYAEKVETLKLTIKPRPIQYVAANELDVQYDGLNHGITVQIQQPSSYHIQYKKEGETEYYDDNPQFQDVRRDDQGNVIGYKVDFKITDPLNKYTTTEGSQTLIIKPRPIQYTSTSVDTTYDGNAHVIEPNTYNEQPPQASATIKYSTTGEPGSYNLDSCPAYTDVKWDSTGKNVEDYKIYFEISTSDKNYETAYGQTSLKINPGTIYYTVGDLQADYNGYYHQIDLQTHVADSVTPIMNIKYYTDDQHTNEVQPYFRNATNGKQKIYYHIDAGSNYKPVDGYTTVDIRPATITYKIEDISTLTYDGDKHGAVISTTNVDDSGSTITYSEDGVNYGLVNPRYSEAGTYTVYYKINAANYKETDGHITFTIQQRPMSYVYIEDIPGRIFNGAPITPSVLVHDGDPSIIRDDDYDVSYTDNTAPGMGIVTLVGKHNYTGSTTKHFMIYSDSDAAGANEVYPFDTSGSSLLGVPSFGASNVASGGGSNSGSSSLVDGNTEDAGQNITDNNNNQDASKDKNDPNAKNTPTPKSFRDYIYLIIGGSILLLSILAVLILKIRSHRNKGKPIDVENIEIPEPADNKK